jgi:hypothetical protein
MRKNYFKHFALILFVSFVSFTTWGQTSTQDFGTGTGSNTSQTGVTNLIPNPTVGTTYARAGAVAPAAPVYLQTASNPLGTTGAFSRCVASSSASVTKMSPIVSYTSGTEFYTSFKVLFGDASAGNTATSGVWTFYQGAQGTNYTDNTDVSAANNFTGLRFTFGASGALTLTYNNNGTYNSTSLTTSAFSQATVYTIEIVGNNKTSGTINYTYSGVAQSVAVQKYDLYINGTLVGNDLTKGTIAANTAINATTFTGVSSTSNVANIFVDDVNIYNAVPAAIAIIKPTVTTTTATSITTTSASSGGNVTADGGASVTARGTAYALTASPTSGTSDGTGTGVFTSSLTPLTVNTQYYYRAYATNSAGTGYGSESNFYTLANVPSAPTVNNPTTTTLDVAVNVNSNPAITQFAIQETTSSNYVQANGSLGASAIWQTAATWGTKTVTGLTPSTGYTFQVKARNGANVETAFSSTASGTTSAASSPILTVSNVALTFGNVCTNTSSSSSSLKFTVNGTALTTADVIVGPLSGYTFATTNGGTYFSTLTLTQPGGSLTQDIFVKFTPTAVLSYSGNIPVSGGGAAATSAAATGAGVNTAPSVTTGGSSSVTQVAATLAGTISATGCTSITGYGIEYSTTNGFSDGSGTQVPSSNLSGGVFSSNLSGLGANTTYYYKAYATNGGGTAYGTQSSFTTLTLTAPLATAGTGVNSTSFTANWGAVTGATSYALDVFTTSPATLTESFDTYTGTTSFVGSFGTWTFSNTISNYTTTGSSGVSPNSVKFLNSGATGTATSPTLSYAATQLKFLLINNASTGSSMLVEGYNGSSWVSIDNILSAGVAGSPGTTFTYNSGTTPALPNNITQFRFTYTKSAGNFAFDDVSINYNAISYVTGYNNLNVGNVTSYPVTGLSPNTTYYYLVRAVSANSTSSNSNTITVITTLSGSLAGTALADFGNVCANTTAGPNNFTLTGSGLSGDVTINALSGFTYSTSSGGTYTSTLTITPTSGNINQVIYVKFTPTLVQSYNGNIVISGGGAASINVAATGSGTSIAAPTGTAAQSFCGGSTVANLTATGTAIQWYSTATGGSPLLSSVTLTNGFHYYASQTISGCESLTRFDVNATVSPAINYGVVSATIANHVVISQVYGGGGNASATYQNDYIELFNPTSASVSLAGWSVQYASATGTSFSVATLSGSIASGGYYLVKLATGGAVGSLLPTADATNTGINMSATAGKVLLASTTTAYAVGCPSGGSVVDFVGYGTTADCREGGGTTSFNAPAASNTTADTRNSNGEMDTDVNSSDFTVRTPSPRNTTSPVQEIRLSFCGASGTPGTMTVDGTVGSTSFTYQWYYQSGLVSAPTGTSTAGWTSLGSTDGANTSSYSPTSSISSSRTYAVFVTPIGTPTCGTGTWATGARQIIVAQPYTWLGASTVWNSASNWSCGGTIPISTSDVIIPSTVPNMPVLTGNITVHGINLQGSAFIDINGNTLTVNGAVAGTGTFTGSVTSNLVIGGAAGTLNFTAGSQELDNLTLNTPSSATLGTALDIYGSITLDTASLNLNAKHLTLKSNASNTASIGKLSGSTLSGATNVTIERYISSNGGGRAWRLLSAPTTGQTINAAWQEGQWNGSNTGTSGFGTLITSTATPSSGNGEDYLQPNSSLGIFSSGAWSWLSSTMVPFATNSGYMIYIRGDRSVLPSLSITGANSTVLRSTGTIHQGTQSAITLSGSYTLVGNVYPSTLDFDSISKSVTVNNSFVVWDPSLPGSYNLGAYQTWTKGSGWTPGGGNYSGSPAGEIQSGQAFFVTGTGSITLTEAAKTTGSRSVFTPTTLLPVFRTNLYVVASPDNKLADGNAVVFDNAYSNTIDTDDAPKISNWGENFGMIRNAISLAVEGRKMIVSKDTIFYSMNNLKQITYALEFRPENLSISGLTAYLQDSYLGTSTPIDLTTTSTVNFTVNSNPGSSAGNRFRIVFNQDAPLPVTFISLNAYQKPTGVQLDWKVANEMGVDHYQVERSLNGMNFGNVSNNVAATGLSLYSWLDANPNHGVNFYRIKAVDVSGQTRYTNIVKVVGGNGAGTITINPNPVTGTQITMQFSNEPAGNYNLRLINSVGQLMYNTSVNHGGGSSTQSIQLPSKFAEGIYQMEIVMPDNTKDVQKLVISK